MADKTNKIEETLAQNKSGKPLRRALQVWFTPQQLLDLAAVLTVATASPACQRILKRDFAISIENLAELGLKMTKEIERV